MDATVRFLSDSEFYRRESYIITRLGCKIVKFVRRDSAASAVHRFHPRLHVALTRGSALGGGFIQLRQVMQSQRNFHGLQIFLPAGTVGGAGNGDNAIALRQPASDYLRPFLRAVQNADNVDDLNGQLVSHDERERD